ncbi:MAG TPA: hypothetical protein H9689_08455 [Firmicutes bacterium]|nr:hypothetical protein [Bacillota bacterium]
MEQGFKPCPYCGAKLPEQASFCPHCTHNVRERKPIIPPPRTWRRLLRALLPLALALAVCAGFYFYLSPKTYDAYGEITYTDDDGSYQLLVNTSNERFEPMPEIADTAELDGQYRMPSRLFINHVASGANAGQMFMQKVEWCTTEFIQPADSQSPMVCSEPQPMDFSPDAALVSLFDYTGRSGSTELLWTLHMKNGDTIKLRQKINITPIETYDYYPEDYPMDTIEELQALIDKVSSEIQLPNVVNIHLPPITYDGELVIDKRAINLRGSVDENTSRRTTFTGNVQVSAQDGPIVYFSGISFIGSGEGVGVSASCRLQADNCRFSNWKTGLLGYGSSWISAINSYFDGNEVGFHFNSEGKYVTHATYSDNTFINNGTGVLLERVPTDVTISFPGSYFQGNGTDIDNRCSQPLDISQAIIK